MAISLLLDSGPQYVCFLILAMWWRKVYIFTLILLSLCVFSLLCLGLQLANFLGLRCLISDSYKFCEIINKVHVCQIRHVRSANALKAKATQDFALWIPIFPLTLNKLAKLSLNSLMLYIRHIYNCLLLMRFSANNLAYISLRNYFKNGIITQVIISTYEYHKLISDQNCQILLIFFS